MDAVFFVQIIYVVCGLISLVFLGVGVYLAVRFVRAIIKFLDRH